MELPPMTTSQDTFDMYSYAVGGLNDSWLPPQESQVRRGDTAFNLSVESTNMADDSGLLRPQNTSTASPTFGVATVTIGIILGLVILFTLIGNGLVVTAVISFRRLRSVTNYFVVSLAVADLTVAVLVMPYCLLFEVLGRWNFGWIFCYFWISCDVTCCTASILHLCVISLDRYLAITQPLTYKIKMSRRRALVMICCVWLCSGAISFVPIYLGWFADMDDMDLYVDSPQCGLYVNKVYAVISSTLSFYFPLIVMLFAYMRIFRIARHQAREIKKQEQCMPMNGLIKSNNAFNKRSKKLRRDVKAIKTLGTLMGLFCVCWLPYFLMYLILPFCSNCRVPQLWVSFITWLGYTNSFINPCVYAFLNRDFRLAFRKILSCFRPGGGILCFRCGRRGRWSATFEENHRLSFDMYEYTTTGGGDSCSNRVVHRGYQMTATRLSRSPSSSGNIKASYGVDPSLFTRTSSS